MPTVYTDIIDETDGDVPLSTYAIRCAHAFGALIERRDSGPSDTLPDSVAWPGSDYHTEQRSKSLAEMARIADMSDEACDAVAAENHAKTVAEFAEARARAAVAVAKYDAMHDKVKAWNPPEVLHGLRDFMLSQLVTGRPYLFTEPDPPKMTGAEWRASRIAYHRRNLAFHDEHVAKDKERAAQANEWLAALRESLAVPRG